MAVATFGAGTKANLRLLAQLGVRQAFVVPQYGQAWMGLTTNIACHPAQRRPSTATATATATPATITLTSGVQLGTADVGVPDCRKQAAALWVAPYTESISKPGAPKGLVAYLPTASIALKGTTLTGMLTVTNHTAKAYTFASCPRATVTAANSTLEVSAFTSFGCPKPPEIRPHGILRLPVQLKIPLHTNLTSLNLAAYLSIGIGDDASLSRPDAKPKPNGIFS